MWKACEDHVKDMWKFHLLFHMGMCEKQCEITMWKPSEMGWSFSHHGWCEKTMWNRKFTSCIVRLGLMIWCEKLCETCFDWRVNMWNFSFTFFFTLSWSSQIRYTYLAGHIIYIYMHADHAHAHDLYAAYSFM